LRGIDIAGNVRANAEPDAAVLAALEDDLNTPKALAELFNLVRKLNKTTDVSRRSELAATILASGALLGIMGGDIEAWFSGSEDSELSAAEIDSLIEKRNAARTDKDFAAADAIRDELAKSGVTIEDSASGTRWRRTG